MQDTGRFKTTNSDIETSETWHGITSCESLDRESAACQKPTSSDCDCDTIQGSDMQTGFENAPNHVRMGVIIGASVSGAFICMFAVLRVYIQPKKVQASRVQELNQSARRLSRRVSAYATLMISRLPVNGATERRPYTMFPPDQKQMVTSLPSKATVPYTTATSPQYGTDNGSDGTDVICPSLDQHGITSMCSLKNTAQASINCQWQ
jgi:hypothetical protein